MTEAARAPPDGAGSWDALLLGAADTAADVPDRWGNQNRLAMAHPMADALPLVGRWLRMPASPPAGDGRMPRVAQPGFGASERMVVSPGREERGILHMPGGSAGHPLSPYWGAGHDAWVGGPPAAVPSRTAAMDAPPRSRHLRRASGVAAEAEASASPMLSVDPVPLSPAAMTRFSPLVLVLALAGCTPRHSATGRPATSRRAHGPGAALAAIDSPSSALTAELASDAFEGRGTGTPGEQSAVTTSWPRIRAMGWTRDARRLVPPARPAPQRAGRRPTTSLTATAAPRLWRTARTSA